MKPQSADSCTGKIVVFLLLSLSVVFVFAALEKGGGDCSAGADQAAKNDLCGGPYKGFCVDSKTSKAACACFDAYEGAFCQSVAATTTDNTNKNVLTALALGLGGAYLLNNLQKGQIAGNINLDNQYLYPGVIDPRQAALSAATAASTIDGMIGSTGSGGGVIPPLPVSSGYNIVLPGFPAKPGMGKFKG